MATVVDIGTLMERSPEIHKGRPCIAGTSVTVQRIAGWHNLGLSPEEIAAKIEHLTLAQIHAALAYYRMRLRAASPTMKRPQKRSFRRRRSECESSSFEGDASRLLLPFRLAPHIRPGIRNEPVAVRHFHLGQAFGIHHLVRVDDAIRVKKVRHQRVDFRWLQ